MPSGGSADGRMHMAPSTWCRVGQSMAGCTWAHSTWCRVPGGPADITQDSDGIQWMLTRRAGHRVGQSMMTRQVVGQWMVTRQSCHRVGQSTVGCTWLIQHGAEWASRHHTGFNVVPTGPPHDAPPHWICADLCGKIAGLVAVARSRAEVGRAHARLWNCSSTS